MNVSADSAAVQRSGLYATSVQGRSSADHPERGPYPRGPKPDGVAAALLLRRRLFEVRSCGLVPTPRRAPGHTSPSGE
eukprot:5249235-Heterocapsa_arctica.AAC.1